MMRTALINNQWMLIFRIGVEDMDKLKFCTRPLWWMAAFFAVLLTACSSDDGSTSSVGGTAAKGPIAGGTVTAYRIDGGTRGGALASTTTDANGNYSLNVRFYQGPLLLEVTGGTYTDEATGTASTALAIPLRAALSSYGGGHLAANITLLTEVAVVNAMADPGGLTAANIQAENAAIKTQVGFDPVTTSPADATNSSSVSASVASRLYGVYLASASQYMVNNPGTTLAQTATFYSAAFRSSTFATAPTITTAQANFLAGTRNQTGIADLTALQALSTTLLSSTANSITSFSINGVAGTIDQSTGTITVPMSNDTDRTALVPTFVTNGASVRVGGTTQESGTTPNNFTNPVTYTVTATDGSTRTYTVTVAQPAGPTTLLLSNVGSFAIFAENGVTSSGVSSISGDVGVSGAASSITGFGIPTTNVDELGGASSVQVTGSVYAGNMNSTAAGNVTAALIALESAYTDAQARTPATSTDLLNGNIGGATGGQTLVPGLYEWNTAVTIPASGLITLNGGPNDVWIFQVSGNVVAGASSNIVLTGGALARNVYWQVDGTVNLAGNAHFVGTILSTSSITLQGESVLNGRALSRDTVSIENATVIRPTL
jgi:hypothetical protein